MHWELLNFYVIYGYICTYTSKNDYLQLKHSCHIVFIQISIATCPVRVIKMWLRYRLSVIYVHFYQIFSSSIFEIGIFFRSYFFLLLKLFLSYHYCIIRDKIFFNYFTIPLFFADWIQESSIFLLQYTYFVNCFKQV